MMDEMLIELVQQEECLFNLAHKEYSDGIKKMRLWDKIGEELGVPPTECKQRWFSLRDQYRRSLKNRKTKKSGQPVPRQKKWRYEKEMSFLLPYLQMKETESNVSETTIASPSAASQESVSNTSQESTPCELEEVLETIITENIPRNSFSSTKKKRQALHETPSSVVRKYIFQSEEEKHPIDKFLEGIAPALKSFTPKDQFLARTKIFSIISEIEAKYYEN